MVGSRVLKMHTKCHMLSLSLTNWWSFFARRTSWPTCLCTHTPRPWFGRTAAWRRLRSREPGGPAVALLCKQLKTSLTWLAMLLHALLQLHS